MDLDNDVDQNVDNHAGQGVFWHECNATECSRLIEFDDEPFCFTHSPEGVLEK